MFVLYLEFKSYEFEKKFKGKNSSEDHIHAILGFDFFSKNRVNLNMIENSIEIRNEKIPFVNDQFIFREAINATMCLERPDNTENFQNVEPFEIYLNAQNCKNCQNSVNLKNAANSVYSKSVQTSIDAENLINNESQCVNAKEIISDESSQVAVTESDPVENVNSAIQNVNIENYEQDFPKNKVYLKDKIILAPGDKTYLNVCSKQTCESDFAFFPSEKYKNFTLFESIHQANNIENSKNFLIYVENHSDVEIHLNKNCILGEVLYFDFKQKDLEKLEQINAMYHSESEEVELITASEEVLKNRKSDFNINDFDLKHLLPEQQQTLSELLKNNTQVFSSRLATLGLTNKVTPHLSLIQDFPLRTLPFPLPQSLEQTALTQLNEMLDAGVIKRSNSEWAAPMLMVKKRNLNPGDPPKFRLALDLRLLNSVIKSSSYPIPKISTIISNLASFKYFTALDLGSAFWQIHLPEKLQDIAAFTSVFGSFKFNRLVQGLKTSTSTFQSLMDSILDEIRVPGIFAYIDDLIICSNSFSETIEKISILFNALSKFNLTLSAPKCVWHKSSISFLGFQIENKSIKPVNSNIVKITSFQIPKTKRQLKRFIGVCGYYRNLIPSYASLIQPLIDLTSSKVTFKWSLEHNEAFEKLQKIFFNSPFVKLPDWDKPFVLNTDASGAGIAGILMQKHDDNYHPISYYSKSLTPAEKRYPALKLELYALYKSVLAFKHHLYNREFTVLTDSKALLNYKHTASPTDVTTRWLLTLSEYSFKPIHIKGINNLLADYFSRLDENPPSKDLNSDPDLINDDAILPIVNNIQTGPIMPEVQSAEINYIDLDMPYELLKNEQEKDPSLSKIINFLKENDQFKPNFFKFYYLHPENNLLCWDKFSSGDSSVKPIIVVPDSLKAKVLTIIHMSHLGIIKTHNLLSTRYYWRGMFADTANFVASCETCLKNKKRTIPKAPLQNTPIPKRPSEIISLDIVGPLSNNAYILTIIDHFSRYIELFPLTTISAEAVAEALLFYITRNGRPSVILTDRGSQFRCEIFEKLANSMKIKLNLTTVAHPEANSKSERINTSIKTTINSLMSHGVKFKHAVIIHQNVYNGCVHPATQFTPNLLHFGRELPLLFDTFDFTVSSEQLDKNRYLHDVLKSLNKVYDTVYENLKDTQSKQNFKFLQKAKLREFKSGDIVYMKSRELYNNKLTGPFEILQRNSTVTYTLRLLNNPFARVLKLHVNRLVLAPPRRKYLTTEHHTEREVVIQNSSDLPSTSIDVFPACQNAPTTDFKTRYYLRSRR